MRHRLSVRVPGETAAAVQEAARRAGVPVAEWVRRAIARSLGPLDRLAGLGAPTADIDRMLAEIAAGAS